MPTLRAAALGRCGRASPNVAPGPGSGWQSPCRRAAFVAALHACLLIGAVAVPVDLRLAPAERGATMRPVRR